MTTNDVDFDDFEDLEPSLQNIVDQPSLKWIFVGGKGGVGKTTTSCCLAVKLAETRGKVLLISTDPAHNLSDAFSQRFSKEPTLVGTTTNLYAMEIDPEAEIDDLAASSEGGAGAPNPFASLGIDPASIQEMAMSMPGIDEAMSFAQVIKLVNSLEFDAVVFDTAPTGHTLRLLALPEALNKGMNKLLSIKDKLGGMMAGMSAMMGGQGPNAGSILDKLEEHQKMIEEISSQFKNPDLTTFVCVCIPEFLSLYETERLVQELSKFEMDVHNVVVNQILYPSADADCAFCTSRSRMQQKYLDQIEDLYEDFNVTKMPLLKEEVRGFEAIKSFSELYVKPYQPPTATTTTTTTTSST
eukprot:TRINITY_DN842_c1_g1_i2.p1 TRINITY_DN842_c1_g1~~TRINITY_DN842_c1_g1_i2.p1  ORF type:complete len:355 (-),score=105.11 TRINITY_DN842_c1_g1_i2:206-1270(-)